jgi:alkylated DNA repair dioxygenase AlkB
MVIVALLVLEGIGRRTYRPASVASPTVDVEVRASVIRPDAAFERLDLGGGSWVDVARGWVADAAAVHDAIVEGARWQQGRVFRYERWVDEPRLGAWWATASPAPHAAVPAMHKALQDRYRVRFDGAAFAWYRDGRDSVAFHRDRELRWLDDTVIAVLTLGARRPWLLRPRANRWAHDAPNGGATHDLAPGPGDLVVMGGRCQADWEHAVPKIAAPSAGRVSIQGRWTSRRGRPVTGGNWRDARTYGRG